MAAFFWEDRCHAAVPVPAAKGQPVALQPDVPNYFGIWAAKVHLIQIHIAAIGKIIGFFIYRVSGANRFSHSMASPCTAFTPSDSLATANNSWILILTFAITSLRNLFPNFLRKKDRHLHDVCLCEICHPFFLILLFYNLFQLFPNFLIQYLCAEFLYPSFMQMLICFCRLP